MIATQIYRPPSWTGEPHKSPSPEPPLSARDIYCLSEEYQHLVGSPVEFRSVLRDKLARLQNTLPQLGPKALRQARADITFLRSVLNDEGLDIAQIRAGAVYSAAT